MWILIFKCLSLKLCAYMHLLVSYFLHNGVSYLFLFWIFYLIHGWQIFYSIIPFYVILQNACVNMHLKYLNLFSVVQRNNPPLFHKGIKLSFYFYLFIQLFILLSLYPFGPTFLGVHCPKNIQICLNPSPFFNSLTRENSH